MQKILSFNRNGMNYHALQFNGSGTTIKDIGAYETIEHAVSQGANVIVNVTSGNNGAALKRAVLDYNHRKPLEEKVKVVHIISSNLRIFCILSTNACFSCIGLWNILTITMFYFFLEE